MPMSIQAVVAMQACARIAATHSVVFGGFPAKRVQERIIDAGAVAVIPADGQFRGGKEIPLKPVIDEALGMGGCEAIKNVIVYKRSGSKVPMSAGRDSWWEDVVKGQPDTCEPTFVDAEHPLFILYTSGSTGKPKGIQHSTGGYLLWCALTMKWVFDNKPSDVFWCTADVGWVTGHSYITYGPLAVGATEVVFEGVPVYPDAGRFWKIIQDHKVNVFYTAPTAIRSLIKAGGDLPKKYDLKSPCSRSAARRACAESSLRNTPSEIAQRFGPSSLTMKKSSILSARSSAALRSAAWRALGAAAGGGGMNTHQPAVSSVRRCARRGPSASGSRRLSARR